MSASTRSVLLIVPDQGLLFEAVGVADIFARANSETGRAAYTITIASTRDQKVVKGSSGLHLMADVCLLDLDPETPWDTILITGSGADTCRSEVSEWIGRAAPHARRIVSVCRGAVILAQAGLLDGRRATTHWKSVPELTENFPLVQVEEDAIYIRDDPIWTSAGASSGFDLALALVEDDLGASVARTVAQYLVLYLRRPGGQSQFSRFLQGRSPASGPLCELQLWMLEHLTDDLRVEGLAEKVAMSPRNFSRVFTKETGLPPAEFVEQIRYQEARRLLEQSGDTVETIASASGFGNALGLRRAFERRAGVTPAEYRQRFGMN